MLGHYLVGASATSTRAGHRAPTITPNGPLVGPSDAEVPERPVVEACAPPIVTSLPYE